MEALWPLDGQDNIARTWRQFAATASLGGRPQMHLLFRTMRPRALCLRVGRVHHTKTGLPRREGPFCHRLYMLRSSALSFRLLFQKRSDLGKRPLVPAHQRARTAPAVANGPASASHTTQTRTVTTRLAVDASGEPDDQESHCKALLMSIGEPVDAINQVLPVRSAEPPQGGHTSMGKKKLGRRFHLTSPFHGLGRE